MHLIALVACGLAAFLGKAVGSSLCAFFTWWDHVDMAEPDWRHLFGEGLGRPKVRTCGKADNQQCAGGSHCQCRFAPPLGSGNYVLIGFHTIEPFHGCSQKDRWNKGLICLYKNGCGLLFFFFSFLLCYCCCLLLLLFTAAAAAAVVVAICFSSR